MVTPAKPTICVDFDGVIHEPGVANPHDKRRMGVPRVGASDAMQELIDRGYRVVVFTSRAVRDKGAHVREWLDYYDIPYHDVTAIKIPALAYIDDRAIRFTDWPQAIKDIDLLLPPLMVE